MSFETQSDVKNHLSHRTRSQIHLIDPINQPATVSDSKVEPAPAELPNGNPAEVTSALDPSASAQSAMPKTVQE